MQQLRHWLCESSSRAGGEGVWRVEIRGVCVFMCEVGGMTRGGDGVRSTTDTLRYM